MRTRDQSNRSGRKRKRREPLDIYAAQELINERLNANLSLQKIAEFVELTPNYLSEKFKQVTGQNFVDYVAQARIDKCCELLHNTKLPIIQIARAVGFQSHSQFNRVFKKRMKVSARQFRTAIATHSAFEPQLKPRRKRSIPAQVGCEKRRALSRLGRSSRVDRTR